MTKLAKHQLGFAALWAVSLLIGWRALVDTFSLSSRNSQYTYLLLIFPVSTALIFLEWRPVRTVVALNVRTGSVCLAIAALIECVAVGWLTPLPSDVQLSTRMLALVLWWIGAFLLCFGSRAWRLVIFPLGFLLGLVPLPQLAVSKIVALLQQGSAWAAHALFAVCGVPVAQAGDLLTIPGLTFQVAHECSSIRSSSMLLLTTVVLSQLLLCSPWRKALMIGLAVPLSVAKNAFRIFTIAMLGTRVDPSYLTGRLHHEGGIVFFAIILLVTFGVLWILRKEESLSRESALRTREARTIGS
jgi:exosortase